MQSINIEVTLNTIRTYKAANPKATTIDIIDQIKEFVEPANIKVIHETTAADNKIGRIILANNRNFSNYQSEIAFQANGVIIDSKTWKVISAAPYAFNPAPKYKIVSQNLQKYQLFEIVDGTILNLYYYEGAWRFSSAKGYDVGSFKWIGDITYAEAFKMSMPRDFNFDQLNQKCYYSFVFKNHHFHPFTADAEKTQLIHVGSNEKVKDIYGYQNIERIARSIGIQPHLPINNTASFDQILAKCKGALEDYLKTGKIFFGYVFRAAFGDMKENSNFIIESSLMKKIRQFIYNFPKDKEYLANNNRMLYVSLAGFLSAEQPTFIKLFPQFKSQHDSFNMVVRNVVTGLEKNIRTTIKKQTEMSQRKSGNFNSAEVMLEDYFKNNQTIKGERQVTKNTAQILRDVIINKNNIDIFFAAFSK